MKKYSVAILLLFISHMLFAQNGSWWEPSFPTQGDTVQIFFDAVQSSEIPDASLSLVLHWGVNESGVGDWQVPSSDIWPPGTVLFTSGDPAVRSPMTKVDGVWQIKIATNPQINSLHYVVNTGTPAMPGSSWGHNTGNTNWNIELAPAKIGALIVQPKVDDRFSDPRRSPSFVQISDTLHFIGTAGTNNTAIDSLVLYINETRVAGTAADTLYYDYIPAGQGSGFKTLRFIAIDTNSVSDTASALLMVNPEVNEAARPGNIVDGINYQDGSTVTFSLFAPQKSFVYLIGDFNDWRVDSLYYMNRETISEDEVHWWLSLSNLTPGEEYAFQYLVGGNLRIADPYTEKVLDPWNDQEIIDNGIYPDLKPYPLGKTTEPAAVMQTDQSPYTWVYSDTFSRPAREELVIYELLVRDFTEKHDYATLIDTLGYLENLGINAIELMPVNEFEGNRSWGYNPSFYFAPDKYYGPAPDLKNFIDACHRRGIAVILDMVFNHSFGQSPMVRLYANEQGWPSAQNPWFNADYDPSFPGYQARHPWSVGYDFNHNSIQTRNFVDRVNKYWLEEFHIDGFRFDLTKGFTQDGSHYQGNGNYSDNSDYDQGRVAILERMADKIWETDSTAYVILEHFAVNDEEVVLSEYHRGMMLWGNLNYNYNEATMGYNESGKSDFSWGYYKKRQWTNPHLVTFMESHDEERLMFKNEIYGNSSGFYDIKMLETALNRVKMAAAFFFTYPGPKMFWQFGELGYDISIDNPCRVCDKPVLWDYYQDAYRKKLYKTFAALIKLRRSVSAFSSRDATVEMSVSTAMKRIRISHTSMNVIIVGNFDVMENFINPGFYYSGSWYDYFSGNALNVTDQNAEMVLQPGEFHIYTDRPLPIPEDDILNHLAEASSAAFHFDLAQNYPNPFNPETIIKYELAESSQVYIRVYDILGREVIELLNTKKSPGRYEVVWDGKNSAGISVSTGVFICKIEVQTGSRKAFQQSRKMILIR